MSVSVILIAQFLETPELGNNKLSGIPKINAQEPFYLNWMEVVERKIIKTQYIPDVAVSSASLPVIKEFNTSNNEIESGGTLTLSWQIENANKLELYKNGAKFY